MVLETPSPEKITYRKYNIVIKRKEMEYEKDEFNTYQNFLYKRALFGLSVYTKEEIDKMHFDKKNRINRVYKHAQNVLNLWKQEIFIVISNRLLEEKFSNSPLARIIIEKFSTPDPVFINGCDFKTLGINKKMIISKLISKGVLPNNFYEIKEPKILQSNRSGDTLSIL